MNNSTDRDISSMGVSVICHLWMLASSVAVIHRWHPGMTSMDEDDGWWTWTELFSWTYQLKILKEPLSDAWPGAWRKFGQKLVSFDNHTCSILGEMLESNKSLAMEFQMLIFTYSAVQNILSRSCFIKPKVALYCTIDFFSETKIFGAFHQELEFLSLSSTHCNGRAKEFSNSMFTA